MVDLSILVLCYCSHLLHAFFGSVHTGDYSRRKWRHLSPVWTGLYALALKVVGIGLPDSSKNNFVADDSFTNTGQRSATGVIW